MKKIKRFKIKTLATMLIALCCITTLWIFTPQSASASTREYEEMDRLFQSTVSEIFNYEQTETTYVEADKDLLYDIELNALGVQYKFVFGENDGFALIIDDGQLTVTEIYLEAQAPFTSDTTNVYVSLGIYWCYENDQYVEFETGLTVTEESVEQLKETAYRGSGELNYEAESLYYLYRSETKYNIIPSIPTFNYGKSNGCAPVAGSNIIAYYDYYFPNLIPDYESFIIFLGVFRYRGATARTNQLCDELYDDMKTNTSGSGTTQAQFRNGLKIYIERQGYSVNYESLMSWGNIRYDRAKEVVQQNKAIAIFLQGWRNISITNYDGYDRLAYEYSNANHVVAGFGCLEVSYTFADYSTRFDRYINVSTGTGMYRNGYINVGTANIDEALVINVSTR